MTKRIVWNKWTYPVEAFLIDWDKKILLIQINSVKPIWQVHFWWVSEETPKLKESSKKNLVLLSIVTENWLDGVIPW